MLFSPALLAGPDFFCPTFNRTNNNPQNMIISGLVLSDAAPAATLLAGSAALAATGPSATVTAPVAPVVVKEFFSNTRQPQENIDSLAVWHGPDG